MKVNHEQFKFLIKTAYIKKLPLFTLGATGIGKSEVVRQTAEELAKEFKMKFSEGTDYLDGSKFHLIDIRISQLDPSDLRGLPHFDNENKKTRWYSPNWMPTKGKGIIFFDELNLAPPSIQAAAYQLILDRKLGDYELPEGYIIIGAGNKLEDKANVFEMPAPLANRFTHCELAKPTVEKWADWAMDNNIDSRVITYLHFKKSHIHKFDERNEERAFPTPRSWVYCSKLIEGVNDPKMVELLASTAIGEGIAIEFTNFHKLRNKLDLKHILANPKTFTLPKEIDVKYALISGLSEHYKEHKNVLDKILLICKRLEPEYGILLLKLCKKMAGKTEFKKQLMPIDKNKLTTAMKIWQDELANEYAKYLLE